MIELPAAVSIPCGHPPGLEILVIYIVDLMKLRPLTLTTKDGSQVFFMDRRMTVFNLGKEVCS